jgi:hypothetical protein
MLVWRGDDVEDLEEVFAEFSLNHAATVASSEM